MGNISIPRIGLDNTEMTGTVDGQLITFGDIDGVITFTGVVTEDATASGSYIYSSVGDEGTWTGSRLP